MYSGGSIEYDEGLGKGWGGFVSAPPIIGYKYETQIGPGNPSAGYNAPAVQVPIYAAPAAPVAPPPKPSPPINVVTQVSPQFTQAFAPQFTPQITTQAQSGPGTMSTAPVLLPVSAPVISPVSAPVQALPTQPPAIMQPVPSGQTTMPISTGPALPPSWMTPTKDGQASFTSGDAIKSDMTMEIAVIGIAALALLFFTRKKSNNR